MWFQRFAIWLNTGNNSLNLCGAITVPLLLLAMGLAINSMELPQ